MNIKINAVRFKADVKLEKFIEEKIKKLAEQSEEILGSEVTLKLENTELPENKIAEIRLLIKGHDLFAKKQSKTFEEAIDTSIDALKKQISKLKERFRN